MTLLVSDAFKASVREGFDCLHQTMSRDIILFSETVEEVSSGIEDNNPMWGSGDVVPETRVVVSEQAIPARVKYIGTQDEDFFNFGGGLLTDSEGLVRIKVKKVFEDDVKKARNIKIDGELFTLSSDGYKIGPFVGDANNEDFTSFILQRAD